MPQAVRPVRLVRLLKPLPGQPEPGAADAILTASGQVVLFGIAASIVLGFTWRVPLHLHHPVPPAPSLSLHRLRLLIEFASRPA